eukprot:g33850.t1
MVVILQPSVFQTDLSIMTGRVCISSLKCRKTHPWNEEDSHRLDVKNSQRDYFFVSTFVPGVLLIPPFPSQTSRGRSKRVHVVAHLLSPVNFFCPPLFSAVSSLAVRFFT